MSNPNKARGTAWETATVRFLRGRLGGPVFRPAQTGAHDSGDVWLGADFVLQCKDWQRWSRRDLSGWLADVQAQAEEARRAWGVVVVKSRREPKVSAGSVAEGIVSMRLDTFAEMVYDLEEGREALSKLEEFENGSE